MSAASLLLRKIRRLQAGSRGATSDYAAWYSFSAADIGEVLTECRAEEKEAADAEADL